MCKFVFLCLKKGYLRIVICVGAFFVIVDIKVFPQNGIVMDAPGVKIQ